jgi:hypothetical protein
MNEKEEVKMMIATEGGNVNFDFKGGCAIRYISLLGQAITGLAEEEDMTASEVFSALYHQAVKEETGLDI